MVEFALIRRLLTLIEEEYIPKKGNLFKYLRIVFNLGKAKGKVFIFFAFISILLTGMNLIAQNMPKLIIDSVTLTENTSKDYNTFFIYASIYFVLMMIIVFGRIIQKLRLEKSSIEIISDLKVRMFSHLTKAKLDFFHRNPVGRLITRIESDVENLRLVFQFLMVTIVGDILQSIAVFIYMFIVDLKLSIWLTIPVIIILISSVIYQKIARPRILKLRRKIAEITGYIAESITGIRTIQAFRSEKDFEERFSKQVEYRRKEELKIFFMLLVYFRSAVMMENVSSWLVILIFGILTQGVTNASIGTLVMFSTLVTIAISPIRIISEQFGQIQLAFASLERVDNIMKLEREDNEQSYTLIKENQNDIVIQTIKDNTSEGKQIKHGIEFKDVWFAYEDTSEDKSETETKPEWVLKGVSFFLPAGKSMAIIGPTGCGKTTIIKLIFRFYEPQKGEILLDGKNINEYSLFELRTYIGLVQQETHLFPGTIRDNITLDNKDIPDDKIIEGAEKVGSDLFIEKRRDNYDAEVVERGMNFSSGEKQLIAFTRCIVYDKPLIILDEATSNIDATSEMLIQKTISDLQASNKTSIMIAHRLSTIRNADIIIVMENGNILEQGNHRELMSLNGRYKQYFKYQFAENNL